MFVGKLTIQAGNEQECEAKMRTVGPKVREEPGNHADIMHRLQDNPRTSMFYEGYVDQGPWTPIANICASWRLICVPCSGARPCWSFTKSSRETREDQGRTAVACHTVDGHGAGNTRALGPALGQYGARTEL
jgi:hypothetical protein